ncbi:phage baseplate assembly protein V [Pseudovibrio brasiliensis]|uniref:Phage baseplate assembly protein V n=1 Tax=Pseudovibrio brasiliensis TaxID=1898042 RepID=A0ABX8AWX9_9HYPH|nr:phage baseplate assembly protein V [Pseudovibrio brasiliensis]QUS59205.1 phage baseplate assembly protein V [Pseudovibrio brasiliensis]
MSSRNDSHVRLSDVERRLSQTVVYGVVEQADYKNGKYRVRSGEILSNWLPMRQMRAGAVRSWEPLHEGEQVVLAAPSGDLAQAAILGSIASEAAPAVGDKPEITKTVFEDGTVIEHDDKNKTTVVKAPSDGSISLQVADSKLTLTEDTISLKASKIVLEGDVKASGGELTHNDTNVGSTHVHGGISPGPRDTSTPK